MYGRARDLDGVELVHPVAGWPAGTEGAVIAEGSQWALVEVNTEFLLTEDGLPLRGLHEDLVHVPYSYLRVTYRPDLDTG
jgi:hypothetical protein